VLGLDGTGRAGLGEGREKAGGAKGEGRSRRLKGSDHRVIRFETGLECAGVIANKWLPDSVRRTEQACAVAKGPGHGNAYRLRGDAVEAPEHGARRKNAASLRWF
jgi:hypothetical protein